MTLEQAILQICVIRSNLKKSTPPSERMSKFKHDSIQAIDVIIKTHDSIQAIDVIIKTHDSIQAIDVIIKTLESEG